MRNDYLEKMYDAIFEDIDENMEMDVYYSWDDVARDFFHIHVYSKKAGREKRLGYTSQRKQYYTNINYRAFKYGKEWKLFVAKHSTHIIKASKESMPNRELDLRIKMMLSAFDLAIKYGNGIITNDNIDISKKKLFKPFVNGAYGLETILIGQIQNSKNLKKVEKQKLISYAKSIKNEEE